MKFLVSESSSENSLTQKFSVKNAFDLNENRESLLDFGTVKLSNKNVYFTYFGTVICITEGQSETENADVFITNNPEFANEKSSESVVVFSGESVEDFDFSTSAQGDIEIVVKPNGNLLIQGENSLRIKRLNLNYERKRIKGSS